VKSRSRISNIFDITVRVIADFVMVQAAMLGALVVVSLLQSSPEASLLEAWHNYYLAVFLPLSVLFPIVYGASGLYTKFRAYTTATKFRRAAASAAVGAMGTICASFLLRDNSLPRTAAVIFSVLIILGTPGIRWLKEKLFEREIQTLHPRFRSDIVLVVGGAGYIGSIVVRKLLNTGYRVRVLDSLVYGDAAIEEVMQHPQLEFMEGDCRNIQDVVRAMAGVRAVVHLAAIVGDPACDQDHQTAREINYAATRMMIEIAKGEGIERFVFASSCSVYGASDLVMDENSEAQPISLYADTKVDSEGELLSATSSEFHPTILRFATIFGLSPRPRFDLVVNLLTAKAMQEGIVTIYNGQQWRPFLHVADAAAAIVRVLESPIDVVSGQVYNVGDSRLNYTLTGIADKILQFFPSTRVEHVENSDRRSYRVSFEKIHGQLGFECSKTLEDGIRELKSALETGLVSDYRDAYYNNVRFLKEFGSPVQKDALGAQVMAALSQKATSAPVLETLARRAAAQ